MPRLSGMRTRASGKTVPAVSVGGGYYVRLGGVCLSRYRDFEIGSSWGELRIERVRRLA